MFKGFRTTSSKKNREMIKIAPPKDKDRFTLWLYPETMEKVNALYSKEGCVSRSDFIEKAIRFYIGFLTAEDPSSFLPNMFLSNMRGIVSESDDKQNRLLFKMAVEIAIMQNIIASIQDIDPASLARVRGECVKEVKRTNGTFSFEDAVDWQKGE